MDSPPSRQDRADLGRLRLREIARWALWFGAATALAQTTAVTALRSITDRLIFITTDIVWRAPLANIALYLAIGTLLFVLVRHAPRPIALSRVAGVFLFLAAVGPMLQVPRLHPYAAMLLSVGVGVQGARLVRARVDQATWLIRTTLPWVVVPCLVAAVAYPAWRELRTRRTQAALRPAGARPNVLVIVLDTVRAASLDLHGYGRATMPALSRFAATGVTFENAIAPSPWTLPSHASMFTGLLPHRVSADWLSPLDDRPVTIGAAMQRHGYDTVGVVANLLYTTSSTGLDRGFLRYKDFPLSAGTFLHQSWLMRPLLAEVRRSLELEDLMVRKTATQVTDEFTRWVRNRPAKPFLAFLNYFDAHAPYTPPAPFNRAFGSGGPKPDLTRRRQWSSEEIQVSVDAYDGALAYMDAELDRLFRSMREQGLLENTIVIVTSDHAEQFGEHGLFDHANSLYRAVLHVPLIVSYPAQVPQGVRVNAPVSLVDLAATIQALTGTADAQALPGRSLAAHWSGKAVEPGPVYSEVSKGINLPPHLPVSRGRMLSVVVDGVHYIRNGDGVEELYDFEEDRLETRNLAGTPEMQERLAAARRAVAAIEPR